MSCIQNLVSSMPDPMPDLIFFKIGRKLEKDKDFVSQIWKMKITLQNKIMRENSFQRYIWCQKYMFQIQFVITNLLIFKNQNSMNSLKKYDFVVVGGGTMGLSTALYLSLQCPEAKTAIVEQYVFGNEEGSSHSQTRVFRSTYDQIVMKNLAQEVRDRYWPEVSRLLGQEFLVTSPYLAFVQDKIPVFSAFTKTANNSNRIKIIPSEEAHKMFPSIPKINTCETVFYEEEAGMIFSTKYVLAVGEYLKKCQNVDVYQNTEVISYENNESGVILNLKSKNEELEFHAKKAAFCCGHWMTKIIPMLKPLMKNQKQFVTYWKMKHSQEYKIGKYPIVVHVQNNQDYNYILPEPDGAEADVKYMIARFWDSNYASDEEFQKQVVDYMRKKMYYHYGEEAVSHIKTETCWYVYTREYLWLIDWTDKHRNTLIVSPCSGQGFKFSPLLGKIVADLLQRDTSIDLFEVFRNRCTLAYQFALGKHAKET